MPLRGYGRKFGGIGVVVKRPMSGRGRGLMRLPSYLPRIKTRGAEDDDEEDEDVVVVV